MGGGKGKMAMMIQSPGSACPEILMFLSYPRGDLLEQRISLVVALVLVHVSMREAGHTSQFFLPAWSWDEVQYP